MAQDAHAKLSLAVEGLALQSNAVPQLPTELIRRIIKLSLPVVSYGTYKLRHKLLKAFSLVNSTWNALAREELYKEVFVEWGALLPAVLEGKQSQPGMRAYMGTAREPAYELVEVDGSNTALGSVTYLSMSCVWIFAENWPVLEGESS